MIEFAEVFNQISVPVLVIRKDGEIIAANKRAFTNLDPVKIGDPAHSLFLRPSILKKLLKDAAQSSVECSANMFTIGRDPSEFSVKVNRLSQATKDPDPLYVLTFKDQAAIRAAKSMRSDFVANVSHEIRSPLTAISGFVESLQDVEDIDDETRKLFLGLMAKETTRMTNLVADLLSLSKVEAKERRALKKLITDPEQVLHQASAAVKVMAAKRGKKIDFQVLNKLPALLGKQDDLLRIFINLLENAVNYSRENGKITFTAELLVNANPLGREAICVTVRDEGEGIPAEEIPRLTERFYRVDKSRSRNVGGTGLGLAIVKHILVRHRGKLIIESSVGVGTTVTVYLPAVPPAPK